jgi:prepilin-type processing-associated H-X9-DG protein
MSSECIHKAKNRDGPLAHRATVNGESSVINGNAYTLIELLVVIASVAVLLAILIPVTRAARERAQRAVCLSNLRNLTLAWIAYADDHDGKLVRGEPFAEARSLVDSRRLEGWLGHAFLRPESRSAILEDSDKGALWPYVRDIDVYHCPRSWGSYGCPYCILPAANGGPIEGTFVPDTSTSELTPTGKRIGKTVLRLTRLTDIVSPGAAERAVFVDKWSIVGNRFIVYYLDPKWEAGSPPPIRHADGVTLSMADGHAEYWKWRGRETLSMPRVMATVRGAPTEGLPEGDYQPQTEEGFYDLQRLQRATWGRLAHPSEETP